MNLTRHKALEEFAAVGEFSPIDWRLLDTALTHPSYIYENPGQGHEHNQRLEFLGDAVLGLLVGEYLFQQYPQRPEGELTKMRAAVVCEATLAKRARELRLGSYLRLGKGEEMSGGRERASILADALEAVIGAIYLSAGLEVVRVFVLKLLAKDIVEVAKEGFGDYKTMLQEWVQKISDQPVQYAILKETGPDHNKRFVAGVSWQGKLLSQGTGRTKKEAEQQAAAEALRVLRQESHD